MLSSEGRAFSAVPPAPSADIRHGPVDDGRRVLSRKYVNVHVFGVLVRRKDAHANHEALLVETQLQRNLLDSADEPMPDLGVAESKIENRRNPLFRNDNDVDFPPLLFAAIDVVAEREDVFVFIHDFIGFRARTVEAPAKSV